MEYFYAECECDDHSSSSSATLVWTVFVEPKDNHVLLVKFDNKGVKKLWDQMKLTSLRERLDVPDITAGKHQLGVCHACVSRAEKEQLENRPSPPSPSSPISPPSPSSPPSQAGVEVSLLVRRPLSFKYFMFSSF